MPYNVHILNPLGYLKYRINRNGITGLLKLTDSKYPKILALGTCYHWTRDIVICKIFNWELRLLHELGHEYGLKHTYSAGRIMHPWGFMRGYSFGLLWGECSIDTMLKIEKRYKEVLEEHQK